MEEGRRRGTVIWSILNAIGSQAMRVADGFILMQTGPEIAVALTKSFTFPLVDQYMLAILLADLRGAIDENTRKALVADLHLMPDRIGRTLEHEEEVALVAHTLRGTQDISYFGHGINMSIAYEGELKLKEFRTSTRSGTRPGK